MCSLLGNLYTKEFNVGHHARKCDNFMWVVFVLNMGEGQIDDQHREDLQSTFHSACKEAITYCWSWGRSTIDMEIAMLIVNSLHVDCQSLPP